MPHLARRIPSTLLLLALASCGSSGDDPTIASAGATTGGASTADGAGLGGSSDNPAGVGGSTGGQHPSSGGTGVVTEAGASGAGGSSAVGGTANTGGSANTGGAGTGGFTSTGGGSATGGSAASGGSSTAPDPNFLVFLLIGQSNMEGVPSPEPQDRVEDPRVRVLAYDNCSQVGRTYNEWYTASPPLHSCGLGVGPGDYFAKTLVTALPEPYTIGLVPCAISGVDIDFFRKDVVSSRRGEFRIPPDDHWDGAYAWVMTRARLAAEVGVIRGILFHQGESDSGQTVWLDKVEEMVNDLRTDLGLGDTAPFLAGELYYDGCCSGHNALIGQIPLRVANSYVISASGLKGIDQYHFDLPGQRELGARYGHAMLDALGLP